MRVLGTWGPCPLPTLQWRPCLRDQHRHELAGSQASLDPKREVLGYLTLRLSLMVPQLATLRGCSGGES